MTFAVELYFDSAADSRIKAAWSELSAASLPAWPLRTGARPHVSILVVDSASRPDIDAVFRSIVPASPFRITFSAVDHFGTDDAIVLLKPDPSEELPRLHRLAVAEAETRGLVPRHRGNDWVPHCTCDYRIKQEQLPVCFSILKRLLPLQVRVQEVGYAEVTPEWVHQVAAATLGVPIIER
jgi:2'-5' RNA ligase